MEILQHKDHLNRQKSLLDEDITLKQALLEQMKKDYDLSDKTYQTYVDLLKSTSNQHLVELSHLNNQLND